MKYFIQAILFYIKYNIITMLFYNWHELHEVLNWSVEMMINGFVKQKLIRVRS